MFKNFKRNRSLIIAVITIVITFSIMIIALYSNSVTVKVNQLNIRSGPSINYSVKATAKHGEKLQVISRQKNWIRVISKHRKTGWVAAWLVENSNVKTVSNLSEATIVLDPGHGGTDTGALSTNGGQEKEYTLQVAQKVAAKLRNKGARVIMTRDSDHFVPLSTRPEVASENSANVFIGFHFDSSGQPNTATGYTVYYYHRQTSGNLAQAVDNQMSNLPLNNRGIKFGNFEVIRDNQVPAILIEGGYINTDHDYNKIRNNSYQNQYANDVVSGLTNYFQSQK